MDDRAGEGRFGRVETALHRESSLVVAPGRAVEAIARTQVVPRLARAAAPLPAGPRLLVDNDDGARQRLLPQDFAPHVERLTDEVLAADESVARRTVERLLAEGVPVERIYADLLGPAARRLGELWSEDRRDFTEVTVGTWRLERLMRELAPQFRAARPRRSAAPLILLAPAPGEQHTFGLHMVAEWFRRAAWQVQEETVATPTSVAALAGARHYDVVALSVGREGGLDALGATIRALRKVSRNRNVGVLVGGPLLVVAPHLATRTGADMTALDAAQAVKQAELLVRALDFSERSLSI